MLGVETSLELQTEHRKRTLYRLDGGSGSDEKLSWLLAREYQIIAKGFSGKRAFVLAQQVSRWDPYNHNSWLGTVASPVDFGRPVHMLVKKQLRQQKLKHSYYVTTLSFPSKKAAWFISA